MIRTTISNNFPSFWSKIFLLVSPMPAFQGSCSRFPPFCPCKIDSVTHRIWVMCSLLSKSCLTILNSFLRCPQNNNLESVHHIFDAKRQIVLYVKQPKKERAVNCYFSSFCKPLSTSHVSMRWMTKALPIVVVLDNADDVCIYSMTECIFRSWEICCLE